MTVLDVEIDKEYFVDAINGDYKPYNMIVEKIVYDVEPAYDTFSFSIVGDSYGYFATAGLFNIFDNFFDAKIFSDKKLNDKVTPALDNINSIRDLTNFLIISKNL